MLCGHSHQSNAPHSTVYTPSSTLGILWCGVCMSALILMPPSLSVLHSASNSGMDSSSVTLGPHTLLLIQEPNQHLPLPWIVSLLLCVWAIEQEVCHQGYLVHGILATWSSVCADLLCWRWMKSLSWFYQPQQIELSDKQMVCWGTNRAYDEKSIRCTA